MTPLSNPRPGDRLLDRYFPDADQETRERARDAFREYGVVLLRLGERIIHAQELAANDSRDQAKGAIIPKSPV